MELKQLLAHWAQVTGQWHGEVEYQFKLPVRDAARLEALCALFPGVERQTLINQLLQAALDEIESTMPYVQGPQVVATDEQGDPIYEDVGQTPEYLRLRRQFSEQLKAG